MISPPCHNSAIEQYQNLDKTEFDNSQVSLLKFFHAFSFFYGRFKLIHAFIILAKASLKF